MGPVILAPNLLDEARPRFLTAVLVTRTKFDVAHGQSIGKLAKNIGLSVLHANELGSEKIEIIASQCAR
jgi:hypothetical protein